MRMVVGVDVCVAVGGRVELARAEGARIAVREDTKAKTAPVTEMPLSSHPPRALRLRKLLPRKSGAV